MSSWNKSILFLKEIKLYKRYKLKKEKSIVIDKTNIWLLVEIISSNELDGINPPEEITVMDRLKLSNILMPEKLNNKKIIKVSKT